MNEEVLEKIYQENLEESIISYLAKVKCITLEEAMSIYYNSKLATKIYNGIYGVQYLDYKELTQILCDTEGYLFQ